jgi:hypothetical protein
MDRSVNVKSFGYFNIPELSDNELTAKYTVTSWADLNKTWKISMYLTSPDTKSPLEMPTADLFLNIVKNPKIS